MKVLMNVKIKTEKHLLAYLVLFKILTYSKRFMRLKWHTLRVNIYVTTNCTTEIMYLKT